MKLYWLVALVVFIFLITYDPKSGKLEKYITTPQVVKKSPAPRVKDQCPEKRYYELQFNEEAPADECAGTPKEFMGAVIQA